MTEHDTKENENQEEENKNIEKLTDNRGNNRARIHIINHWQSMLVLCTNFCV